MRITFLGHAGFYVETATTILIMDAWVSKFGAFDGGWFQFPKNHHMGDFIKEQLRINQHKKNIFVYVSHEHKDHFDADFLKEIEVFDFKYLIPLYRRTLLYDQIKSFSKKEVMLCGDEELIPLNGKESIRIFSDDSELNRDSAILFESNEKKFLNLNDCKIHDRLEAICETAGPIHVFSAQYSGATWHPTCYEYTEEEYTRISRKKKFSKFEATALAIEKVKPQVYLPAAGPACFLDPDTIALNFQKESIFPRSTQIVNYLDKRLKGDRPLVQDMMPHDCIVIGDEILFEKGPDDFISEENFNDYINNYAKAYESFFEELKKPLSCEETQSVQDFLIEEFKEKLRLFKSREQIDRPLYVALFNDKEDFKIKIDFQSGTADVASEITEINYYRINVQAYDILRIKNGFLTWEDYSLTFRMRLNREPDIYQVLMQGFLILEKEDLSFFCDKILEIENRSERIDREVGACKYRHDRYCPHQGADLKYAYTSKGRFLVCPRHRWEFDMEDEGKCLSNDSSINAIPLETD